MALPHKYPASPSYRRYRQRSCGLAGQLVNNRTVAAYPLVRVLGDDMDAAVLLPAPLVVVVAHLVLFAVTDQCQLVRRDTNLRQIVLRRARPLIAERHVVFL